MKRALVIGAGLGGLAAAVELKEAGVEVEVWDPDGAGGKARSLRPTPDWLVENGPHTFTGRAEAVFAFASRLGLESALLRYPAGARYIVRGGKLRKAPLPALGAGELISLVRGLFRSRAPAPDETMDTFLRTQFGAAVADGFGQVGTVGIWACGTHEVELRAGFPTLWSHLQATSLFGAMRAGPKGRGGTWGMRGGMGTLAQAASERAGGVKARAAVNLSATPHGWRVDGEVFDGVVVAADAAVTAELLTQAAPVAAGALAGIRYSPLLVAHWTGDAELPHGFGWLTHPAERSPMIGTLFASDLTPDRAPAGARAFTTMIGGTFTPDAVGTDEQGARKLIADELRRLGRPPPRIDQVLLSRHPRAVSIPAPGHLTRIADARAALPPRLAIAGAWCGSGAMPDAIESGILAARRLTGAEAAHVA